MGELWWQQQDSNLRLTTYEVVLEPSPVILPYTAWLTSLVLRDCNPPIPVLALGRVTIKTEKMVRSCDLMQIRLGAEGGT